MDNLKFRQISEDDLHDVLEIYNYYIKNTTVTFHSNPMSINEMKDVVFFDDDKYKTFVILFDEKIIGYVLIYQFKKREAYDKTAEVSVYLSVNYTGRKIGLKALEFIENYARKVNIHTLLAIICAENEQSIKLFAKNGYERCALYKEVGIKFDRYLDVEVYQKIL